jgi:hypothetical protein
MQLFCELSPNVVHVNLCPPPSPLFSPPQPSVFLLRRLLDCAAAAEATSAAESVRFTSSTAGNSGTSGGNGPTGRRRRTPKPRETMDAAAAASYKG